ncbi:hypothetical protein AB0D04_03755 [Streptomyces sp. NPDC048483]|uniref:hypothetical protein n=1 Tax=Streptomyces sp. NPDC048483 TaxID=3154927 RepID=UPI003444EB29
MTERSGATGRGGRRPSVVAPDAVRARIGPPRRRRRMSRREWAVGLPLMVFCGAVLAAILLATLTYALVGTDAPFLVNARGPARGPAPAGARVAAALLFAATAAVVSAGLWAGLRRRSAPPCVAVDGEGVWLTRGRYVQQGLRWARIAAVEVAADDLPGDAGAVGDAGNPAGAVRAPFLDLYPVERAPDSCGPLGSRLITARPAARGLRGRRYAFELTGDEGELAALRAALERWATGRFSGR